MNHYYRIVFNRALGVMQAVSEHGRARSKAGRNHRAKTDRDFNIATVASAFTLALIPGPAAAIDIDHGTERIVTDNETWNVSGELNVGNEAQGTLTISDGGTVNATQRLYAGYQKDSLGRIAVTGPGSSLNIILEGDSRFYIGAFGAGELAISNGGVVNSEDRSTVGLYAGSLGKVHVDGIGSAWNFSDSLTVGLSGRGELLVSNGGAVNGNGKGLILVGREKGVTSVIRVLGSDSTLSVSGTLNIGVEGNGSLLIDDGATVDAGSLHLGNSLDSNAEVVLQNTANRRGAMETRFVSKGSGSVDFVLDGGVIRAKQNEADFMRNFAPGDVRLANGGAYIDTNGFDVSINAPLSGTGPLIKQGPGALLLSGDNTFTGGTIVEKGTLLVGADAAGRLTHGMLTVQDGGILGGAGHVGSTVVESGGVVAPGNSIGTLTIDGNLTLENGSALEFELGSPHATDPAQGVSDRTVVNGTLTLNGTTLNLIQSAAGDDGQVGQGYYRLMTATTLIDNGLAVGDEPDLGTPAEFKLELANNNVDLFVRLLGDDTLQHWQGGDGTWNDTDSRWLNDDATTPTAWAGRQAVFKDAGSHLGGMITVEGTQGFEGLQFVDNGYWLQGTGALQTAAGGSEIRVLADQARIDTRITGPGGIAKTQGGTLVLSGANTYAGGTRLLDGVLSISSDDNLGHENGALEFDGGTLRITESSFGGTRRPVRLGEQGGGFDMAFNSLDDETVTFDGDITGPGRLNKLGQGNLRLTGDNDYGDTVVHQGELIGNSRSLSGNIHIADDDTAAVTFDEGSDAHFAGNITSINNGQIPLVKEGAGTLTLTGTSTVNWFIDEGGLMTSANRFQGYVALAPDAAITFDEAGDATLASAVLGAGRLNKIGEGTLRLPGDSGSFTGHTTVYEGTLSVGGADGAGRLGGTLAVGEGGTLSGTGQVGATTIQSGGAVAPGNSIGTLTVAGDLTFESGSRYDVEVNPEGPEGTESDLIKVTGRASLQGGSVAHVGANGLYAPESSYRILSADTGLTGAFDQVTSNLAFLTPSLAYDYDNHTIDLHLQRNGSSFESLAHTPNQRATAYGLSSLPSGHALHQRILNLPEGAPAEVFDSLSGEVHASAISALHAGSGMVRTLPLSHMRKSLSAGRLPGAPLAQANDHGLPPSSLPQSAALPLWAEVVGSWQTLNSDGNAAKVKQSIGGIFVGGDHHVGAGWRVGAALGYTDARLRIDDRDSKADIATYSTALYGGKAFELETGRLNLMLGGAYGRHDIDSRRHASLVDWNHTLEADYHAHTSQLFGELGYALPMGQATVEPFAGLAWTDIRVRGFEESGGPTALAASSQSHNTTASTLGLRVGTGFALGQAQGRLHASMAWRHAFGSLAPQRTLAFDGSQPFTVAGAPTARNTALLELAAEIAISSNATAGMSYGAQLGGGNREHAAKVNVQWRF